ncbi:MAG: electron transport complex subunit RsxC [Clostridia bacterium]
MKEFTFLRGAHVPDGKALAADKAIEIMPSCKAHFICLQQHMGAPAFAEVNNGDTVKRGQLVASAVGAFSSNIFSPISGTVKGIVKRSNNMGILTDYIEIENDFNDESVKLPVIEITKENILQRVFDAGIVGMGGAGFPTAVKLKPKTPVDTLIINGAECEPYLTCDYRVMLEYTDKLIKGIALIAKALDVTKVYVGIETNKPKAIEALLKASVDITVIPLKKKYPQGAEKQLIYACVNRTVKVGGLPSDVGVVVQNIQTALNVYYAVVENQPLYERIMTVSGKGINEPKNLLVRVGTPYAEILSYCGGMKENTAKLIAGGPMMGMALLNDSGVTTKTDGGLTALIEGEAATDLPTPCINCARCAAYCPMNLMPMYIDFYTLTGDYEAAIKYGVKNCFECGTCAYVCPAKRTLVQSIKLCKAKLKEMKK